MIIKEWCFTSNNMSLSKYKWLSFIICCCFNIQSVSRSINRNGWYLYRSTLYIVSKTSYFAPYYDRIPIAIYSNLTDFQMLFNLSWFSDCKQDIHVYIESDRLIVNRLILVDIYTFNSIKTQIQGFRLELTCSLQRTPVCI